jgi:DNA invertase Pin-like site-specific DNA recombinase
MTTRAAIYCRISQDSTGQQAGVTRQLKDCKALAKRLGWRVVATYTDNDISAFNGATRPGFEDLLAAVTAGDVDAILCWHTDRLYRRIGDLERLVDIADAVQIRTVNAGDLDLSNSTGRMLARILGSVAQQESEHKGERRRAANLQRAEAGAWRADGNRPFGYTQHGQPLEPEATAVRAAARDVLAGRSLRSICVEWNTRGLRTPKGARKGGVAWTNSQLRRVLTKPVYAGLRVYTVDGKTVERPGDWDALIDVDTWRGLVAFLADDSRRPSSSFERRHMLSGVAVCGICGAPMYAAAPHGPDRPKIYACKPSKHCSRLAGPLDELVESIVLALLRDPRIGKRLTARDDIDVTGLRAKREALTATKGKLATLLREGVLDEPGVRQESKILADQIAGINTVLAEAVSTTPAAVMAADGPDEVARHWDVASPDMRGKVVAELLVVVVKPTPPGVKGVTIDRETGARFINTDYIDIKPKV